MIKEFVENYALILKDKNTNEILFHLESDGQINLTMMNPKYKDFSVPQTIYLPEGKIFTPYSMITVLDYVDDSFGDKYLVHYTILKGVMISGGGDTKWDLEKI